jgi:hypothetical protein
MRVTPTRLRDATSRHNVSRKPSESSAGTVHRAPRCRCVCPFPPSGSELRRAGRSPGFRIILPQVPSPEADAPEWLLLSEALRLSSVTVAGAAPESSPASQDRRPAVRTLGHALLKGWLGVPATGRAATKATLICLAARRSSGPLRKAEAGLVECFGESPPVSSDVPAREASMPEFGVFLQFDSRSLRSWAKSARLLKNLP